MDIKINMNSADYDTVFKNVLLKEQELVDPDQSEGWIDRNINGKITKDKLDEKRH